MTTEMPSYGVVELARTEASNIYGGLIPTILLVTFFASIAGTCFSTAAIRIVDRIVYGQ